MTENKVLKNTIYYSIGEVFPRIIGFIMLPVYTRYLSPADYGMLAYTNTIILFLNVLGSFSLNSYVLRFYFEYDSLDERKKLIGTAHLSIILLNFVVLALSFLLLPSIITYFKIQVPWNPYFRYAILANFAESFCIIPLVIYRVRREAFKFMILGLARTSLTVALTIYLVVYRGMGILGTYRTQMIISILFAFVYIFVIAKYASYTIRLKYVKEGVSFAAPLIPGAISYILLTISDRIILERNVSISDLGIYNVAGTMALALNIVVQSGYKAIEPEMFRRFGTEEFYTFTRKAQSVYFFAIFLMAFIICLFSQEVFFYMTSEGFHDGFILVPALIVGGIMTGQNVIYGGVLQGEKRTKVTGVTTVIGATISISINLLLVPLWGVYAAAAASALSFMVMNTILFYKMTFPNKSMKSESFIVLSILILSYLMFILNPEISLTCFFIKIILVCLFAVVTSKLLDVNSTSIRFFVNMNNGQKR